MRQGNLADGDQYGQAQDLTLQWESKSRLVGWVERSETQRIRSQRSINVGIRSVFAWGSLLGCFLVDFPLLQEKDLRMSLFCSIDC